MKPDLERIVLIGALVLGIGSGNGLIVPSVFAEDENPHMGTQESGPFRKVVLVSDEKNDEGKYQDTLVDPMELDVADDGSVYFVERRGTLKVFRPDSGKTEQIGEIKPFTGLEDGLLGMSLHPDFENNQWIFLYYGELETLKDESGKYGYNRLSRFTLKDGRLDNTSEKVVLKVRSQREQCCHSGGSVNFDANGNLYLSTGDNTNPFHDGTQHKDRSGYGPIDERAGRSPWDAQKSASNANDLRGKILRIHPEDDGTYTIPDGNLFPKGTPDTRPEIYVMGCRNPFRIGIDPKEGILYWGDVGPDAGNFNPDFGPAGFDEVNQAKQAGFFGWPYFVGNNSAYFDFNYETKTKGDRFSPKAPVNDSPNNTGIQNLPPAQPAFIFYPHSPSARFPVVNGPGGRTAMAGPTYYFDEQNTSSKKLPESLDHTLFIYEWSRNWIITVKLNQDQAIESMERFCPDMTFKRPMDMELGPDGCLYLIEFGTNWGNNTDSQIIRIECKSTQLSQKNQ
ncbi:MAG: PQQ-dependent sugar dehydrogenase [Verrucomicrobia bacterium]|nr:PQQ-dependent sugar dehydrogenase [Verrucomicrobiota bacterium]